MKKVLFVVIFILSIVTAKAQLRKNPATVSYSNGMSVLCIRFFDASTINSKDYLKKIEISDVTIDVIIKNDTIRLYSGKYSAVSYEKPLRTKEIELIISRDGYQTLKEKWKVESLVINIEAYLTKEQEGDK